MRTGNRSISISGTQGSDHHARNTGAPAFFRNRQPSTAPNAPKQSSYGQEDQIGVFRISALGICTPESRRRDCQRLSELPQYCRDKSPGMGPGGMRIQSLIGVLETKAPEGLTTPFQMNPAR